MKLLRAKRIGLVISLFPFIGLFGVSGSVNFVAENLGKVTSFGVISPCYTTFLTEVDKLLCLYYLIATKYYVFTQCGFSDISSTSCNLFRGFAILTK